MAAAMLLILRSAGVLANHNPNVGWRGSFAEADSELQRI
jgi:hypothetical protein